MPNIQPFRTVNEYDVINLYRYSGTLPVTKGTFVRVVTGWHTDQELAELGSVGASYGNTVSQRYGVVAAVSVITTTGQAPIGMLLNDVREVDENGEKLIFNPRKQAEMQCVLSGQAVPLAVRGIFLYSGITNNPTGGSPAYSDGAGGLSTVPGNGSAASDLVGKWLGPKNDRGHALLFLDL